MANWGNIGSRGNVEDRRGLAPAVGGIGITGIAIVLLVSAVTGTDPTVLLSQLDTLPVQTEQRMVDTSFEGNDEYEVFASTVLGSNNDMWTVVFNKMDRVYNPPKLVLFREATQSNCGTATSSVGPHYCPIDQTIYLDETFFDELTTRFGARGGDVAEAYVIAHEVGHHVQGELGFLNSSRSQTSEGSIETELQADCFAGMWAHSIKDTGVFNQGEIEEAIDAAAAVGDDRIQERVMGYVNPESWTHGSSEQRTEAFNRGYESGDFNNCS